MRFANRRDFAGVFRTTLQNAAENVAFARNPDFRQRVDVNERERAVGNDEFDALTAERFRDALRGREFAVAGESGFGREVGGTGDEVGLGGADGAVVFDVAQNQVPGFVGRRALGVRRRLGFRKGSRLFKFENRGRVVSQKTHFPIERRAVRRDARR